MGFREDVRGQSVVIGSLLIFTILILAFSGYQAYAVPNQNTQVEVEHLQDTEQRFSELRSNVINAVGSNETRSVSFDLGTRYPSRLVALNPPPAAGRLETTEPADVSIVEAGTTLDVCSPAGVTPTSRSLVYTPGYNEYREPVDISYENRLLTRQFEGGSLYDQRLVRDASGNDRISLFLLTGQVSENGVDAYSLEVNASNRNTATVTDPVITVPSRFDAATWNAEILDGRADVTAASDPTTDGRVILTFTGGDYELSCAVIGLDSNPAFIPPTDGGSGSGGGGGSSPINPNAPGDIRLNGVKNVDKATGTVTLEFQNLADDGTALEEARLSFYKHTTGSPHPTNADLQAAGQPVSANLVIRGKFTDVANPEILFPGTDTTEVLLTFDGKIKDGDWFVLTFQYDNGETGQYFVSLSDMAANSPVGGGAGSGKDLQVVDGSTPGSESRALEFDLENTGSSDATITAFEVTTPGNQNSGVVDGFDYLQAPGNNDDEVTISTPRGSDGSADASLLDGNDFETGVKYDMDKDATIKAGDTASVVMEQFNDGNVKLTYDKAASKGDSDVTVTVTRADGSTEELYFRVTNVNS